MEVNRQKSRVVIQDAVYEKIQDLRYSRHLRSLENLKTSPKKCTSQYLVNKNNIAQQLDRYKQGQREVRLKLDPNDTEYKNCQRRLHGIEGGLKLPKIGTLKLKENKLAKEQAVQRIHKQNEYLKQSIAHLSLQKSQKRREMAKSIEAYQLYRRLSRRVHNHSESRIKAIGAHDQ